MGKILAYIRAEYNLCDSIIYLCVYACMGILLTAEGEQHSENAPQFSLVNSWLRCLRGVQGLSGSWADDRSIACSVFSSFESHGPQSLCKYFLLFIAASRDAGRADLLSDFLPPDYPERQTWHQHPHLDSLLSCSTGKHTEQSFACCKLMPAQQCSRHTLLRGGGQKNIFSNSQGKFDFPSHVLCFFPTLLNVRLLHSFFKSSNC